MIFGMTAQEKADFVGLARDSAIHQLASIRLLIEKEVFSVDEWQSMCARAENVIGAVSYAEASGEGWEDRVALRLVAFLREGK